MKTNQTVSRISRQFRLNPVKTTVIKSGVYQLVSGSGKHYCLKSMSYPTKELLWIDHALLQLRKKGFHGAVWRNPNTVLGKIPFVRSGSSGKKYILTHWEIGSTPDPNSKDDMHQSAQFLARFHQAGTDLKLPLLPERNWLGQWPTMLRERAKFLERELKNPNPNNYSPTMNELLKIHGGNLVERANQALLTLKNSDYDKFCKKAEKHGSLCHGDSGHKNIVFTQDGPRMIDFETLRVDLRVYDLFRLIRLSFKKNRWNMDIARAILHGYQSVTRLEPSEYDLLGIWFQFPYKAYKLLSKYEAGSLARRKGREDRFAKTLRAEQNLPALMQLLSDERERS